MTDLENTFADFAQNGAVQNYAPAIFSKNRATFRVIVDDSAVIETHLATALHREKSAPPVIGSVIIKIAIVEPPFLLWAGSKEHAAGVGMVIEVAAGIGVVFISHSAPWHTYDTAMVAIGFHFVIVEVASDGEEVVAVFHTEEAAVGVGVILYLTIDEIVHATRRVQFHDSAPFSRYFLESTANALEGSIVVIVKVGRNENAAAITCTEF